MRHIVTRLTRLALLAAALGGAGTARAQTPALSLSQSSLTFTRPLAGGEPAQQAVTVGSTGAPATALAVRTTYETLGGPAASGWLAATLDRTTTPAVLTLKATSAGIPATTVAGQYRATLDIAGTGATGARLLVSLVVPQGTPSVRVLPMGVTGPTLAFEPGAALDAQTAAGAVVLATDNDRLPVTGLAVSRIDWDFGKEGPWLDATLDRTITPAVLRLVARRRVGMVGDAPIYLAAGYHRATVTIATPGAAFPTMQVLVSLDVPGATPKTGTPGLSFATYGTGGSSGGQNPTLVTSSFKGQSDPTPLALVVVNDSATTSYLKGVAVGAPSYAAGQPTGWLTVSQEGAEQGALVLARASSAGLAPGSYTATVPVSATGDARPHVVTVRYDVKDPTPVLAVVPGSTGNASWQTSALRAGADPNPTAIVVSNAAPDGALPELAGLALGAPVYPAGQPTGWLEAALVDARATTSVVLRPHVGTLREGSYTADLPVLAPGALNAPRKITVGLVVTGSASPTLALSSTSVAMTALLARDVETQALQVRNASAGVLRGLRADEIAFGVGQPTGWLTAALDRDTASASAVATLTLRAAMGALPGGTYTATVTVRAADGALDSPQAIAVTFTVPPRPRLALGAAALAFTALAGTSPAALAVPVTNDGQGTLGALALGAVAYGAGQPTGWLQATLSGRDAPATLGVAPQAAALAAGTYTATVEVYTGQPGVIDARRTVAVSLVVAGRPRLALSETAVALATDLDGVERTRAIAVTNGGQGALAGITLGTVRYDADQPTGWLTAALSGASAPATITLAAAPGALEAGRYVAHVPVLAAGADASPQTIDVTFDVPERARIRLESAAVAFNALRGAEPAERSVRVENRSEVSLTGLSVGAITYGDGQPAGWLSAALSGTTAPATLALRAAAGALPAGSYAATVTIASSKPGVHPESLAVTLTVGAPRLVLATSGVTLDAAVADDSVAATVAVANGGAGALAGIALGAPTYDAGQPSGWLAARVSDATAPATITLVARLDTLSGGRYVAHLPVAAAEADGSPQALDVAFVVPERARLALSAASVALAGTRGAADPDARTVLVTNAGRAALGGLSLGAIAYASGQPDGWLTATLDGGAAPATLTLRAATGALAAGTYTATVPVRTSKPGAADASQAVAVTFTVVGPRLALARDAVSIVGDVRVATATERVAITNVGAGELAGLAVTGVAYGAGQPGGWLAASLSATSAPAELTLAATMGALAPGTYSATVALAAAPNVDGAPVTLGVTYVVPPRPAIALAASDVALAATERGADPAPALIAVSNGAGGALEGLAVSRVTYAAGQPAGWLDATLSATAAPAVLALQARPGALAPGRYTASVEVASSLPGLLDGARHVAVIFVVQRVAPVVVLSSREVTLSAAADSGVRRPSIVQVTNGSATPVSRLATTVAYDGGATGWLQASFSREDAPAALTLGSEARGLAPGLYTATVAVGGADGATAAPLRVTLEVVDLVAAVRAVVRPEALAAAERARLDLLGNHDATYNLGDLLALLARTGLATSGMTQ